MCAPVLQEFLEAMTAYYYGDKPNLSDEEFSLLKEELIWNGSKVGFGFWGPGSALLYPTDWAGFVHCSLWCGEGQRRSARVKQEGAV